MATLFNTKISATYEGLLKTIDNAAISATLRELTDGSGNQSGLFLNTLGDFKVTNVLEWGSLKDTGTGVTITQFVTAANGIENFNNDTTLPTSAAVKLYVDTKFSQTDTLTEVLGFGNTTSGKDIAVSAGDDVTFSDTSKILIGAGSELQIYKDGSNSKILHSGIGLLEIASNGVVIRNAANNENMITAVQNGEVALYFDNDKKLETTTTGFTVTGRISGMQDPTLAQDAATKSYVDGLDAGSDLDITDGTNTGEVNLNTQTLSILGTTNEIDAVVSGQGVTIGLPTSISTNLVGNVTGNLTGNVTGDLTGNVTSTSVLANGVTATTQASNDDSTKVATTAYVKGLDNASDLDFSGDSGSGDVNLNTQTLAVTGTTNQIESTASNQGLNLKFPTAGVTLPNGSLATTQSAGDNSTKISTTQYVDSSAALYLPLAGGTMSGNTIHNDNVKSVYGTGSDAQVYHDGSNFYANNTTGQLNIDQSAVTESIVFKVSNANALDTTALTINREGNLITGKDVTIAGDLTVNGTTTTVNSQTLSVDDPLISLAINNAANSLDIGYYGKYNDGTARYLGLFNDASDSNKFKLFRGTTVEPTTTVNIGGAGYVAADLVVAGLEASLVTSSGDVIADTHFNSSDSNATLSTTGAGTVFLRPNGKSTTTGQLTVGSNGDVSVAGKLDVNGTGTSAVGGDFTINGGDLSVGNTSTSTSVINMLGTNDSFIEKDQGNDLYFANNNSDKDIKFRLKDNGVNIVALTLDGSAGGNATFAGNVLIDGFTNNKFLSLRNSACCSVPSSTGGIGLMALDHTGANRDGLALYGHDGVSIYTAQEERMRLTNLGNVGIGTTDSPDTKLHIQNGSSGQTYTNLSGVLIDVNGTSNSYSALRVGSSTGNNHLVVTNAGNVGIGTTSPGTKLDIISSGLATMFRLSNTEADATTKYGSIVGRHYTNSEQNVTAMLITSGSSTLKGNKLSIGGGISSGNAANNILFYTAANKTTLNGTQRMVIDQDGNVGIGNTAPEQLLHVGDGSDSARGIVAIEGAGGSHLIFSENSSHASGANAYCLRPASGTNFIIQQDGSAAPALTIDTGANATFAGNVNIGAITGAARPLLVKSSSDNTDVIVVEHSGNTVPLVTLGQGANHGYLKINNNGGANKVFFNSAGNNSYLLGSNFGIGTSSPGAKLDIKKDDDTVYDPSADDGQRGVGATIQLNNNSTTTNTFGQIMHDTDSSGQAIARIVFLDAGNASSAMAFVTENGEQKGERMRIAPNGNVGIGAITPHSRLDVNGVISGGVASEDPNMTVTGTGMSLAGAGCLFINQSFVGTSAPTPDDTLVFTYAATSWKSWALDFTIASTDGVLKGTIGGYNNNSATTYQNIQMSGLNVAVVMTKGGTGGFHNIITFTGEFGIHPMVSMKYSQGGGDGAPRTDRASLVFTNNV